MFLPQPFPLQLRMAWIVPSRMSIHSSIRIDGSFEKSHHHRFRWPILISINQWCCFGAGILGKQFYLILTCTHGADSAPCTTYHQWSTCCPLIVINVRVVDVEPRVLFWPRSQIWSNKHVTIYYSWYLSYYRHVLSTRRLSSIRNDGAVSALISILK